MSLVDILKLLIQSYDYHKSKKMSTLYAQRYVHGVRAITVPNVDLLGTIEAVCVGRCFRDNCIESNILTRPQINFIFCVNTRI